MKFRRIYNEDANLEDLSKDRIHLDLSYQEWRAIKTLIKLASYDNENKWIKKEAKRLSMSIDMAKELKSIWVSEKKRAHE